MFNPPVRRLTPALNPIAKSEFDALIAKGEADPTATRTLRCRTVARRRFTQINYIRDLPPQPMAKSEPEGLSNEDLAPNASEAILAALGSCLAAGIHANAIARNIPLRRLELALEGDVNMTAVWGTGAAQPMTLGFEAIRVTVSIEAEAAQDSLEALVKHATLWSPVASTLHNPVHLDVGLAPDPSRARNGERVAAGEGGCHP